MNNYFQGTVDHPYHISVGAVVINDNNEICCHYFGDGSRRNKFSKYSDFYLLMRESMEMGESIEQTLHRGLKEEFNCKGEIITYIGSLQNKYFVGDTQIEKTTLYFMVKYLRQNEGMRDENDPEGESEIQWQTPDFLIEKMKEQAVRLGNETFDESVILERSKEFLR
jgi:ADP-ribose pyrophosphatase YjhB (NUDIX family)